MRYWTSPLLAMVALMPGLVAQSAVIPTLVPPGLNPGDHYQLIFVTAGTRTALSSSIADYNTFVNQDADAYHIGPNDFSAAGTPIHWQAIVSVFGTNAKENAPQLAPVYNLGGQLVAQGGLTTFLYEPLVASPVRWSPDGSDTDRLVFTGTSATGIASTFPAGTGSPVTAGNSGDIGSTWITLGFGAPGTQPADAPLSIYALSDVLIAPEPASAALIALGVGLLFSRRPRGLGPSK